MRKFPVRTLNSQPSTLNSLAALLLTAGNLFAAGFDNNIDKDFQLSPGGKLSLEANMGSVNITTSDSNAVRVHVLRHVKGGTQAQADEVFANHEVTFQQNGDSVSIEARNKKNLSWSWRNQVYLEVSFQITIPKKFDVGVKTAGGNIQVGDLDGNVKARTSSGAIELGQTAGNVEAKNSGGNIALAAIDGDLLAETSSGSIKLQKVQGKAELSNAGGDIQVGEAGKTLLLRTSSGSIKVENARGDVGAHNAGGDISIAGVEGELKAETSSGAIHLGKAQGPRTEVKNAGGDIVIQEADGTVAAATSSGSIRIKQVKGALRAHNAGGEINIGEAGGKIVLETSSGPIILGLVKGEVRARNSGGNVQIAEADGQTAVQTTSGSIAIKQAKGKVEARNAGGDIKIEEARAAIQASTSSGNIRVDLLAQPNEDCHLEVLGGGITMTLPKSAAINLDAMANGGSIKSELPLTITEQKSNVLQGKINGGGPNLILRSSSGDIDLKANSAAVVTLEDDSRTK